MATEVVEATEVFEAAEVPDAREITQYVKHKVLFSAKMHKKAKNVFFLNLIFYFHVSSYRGLATSKK